MPPKSQVDKARAPSRADILREYSTTEKEIAELRRLPLDEALFRIGHECEQHVAWARRKKAFLVDEVRRSRTITGPRGGIVEFVTPRDGREADGIGAMRLG